MLRLLTALLLFVSAAALAASSEALSAASEVAYREASKLSLEGKYAEAAATLLAVDTKFSPRLSPENQYQLDGLKRVRAVYETRAQAAPKAGQDKGAARALLLSLLEPARFDLETAKASDKRVAAVLEDLRRLDPKARKFFSPRPVRVVVTGEGLSASEASALVDAVVGPLRELGFVASGQEGIETLTLAVTLGETIKGLGKEPGLLRGMPESTISCELKIDASWTEGATPIIRLDLATRGLGYSDIPGQCVGVRIKEIPALVAPRLVRRWDSDHAP